MQKLVKIKDNFFKQWSHNMAYVLGFIVADGCIVKRKDRKNSYILNITSKDRGHLVNIKKVMSCSSKIGLKSRGGEKEKKYSFFNVCNREICNDLINLKILPRKTYNLKTIAVPDSYFSDFARGFFDGDGTVYIYNVNNTPQIKAGFLSVSFPFIFDFSKNLCRLLGISNKVIHVTNNDKRFKNAMPKYNIYFYISDTDKLCKFMYGNGQTLYLKRKNDIFEKWKSVKRRHYIKKNYPSKIGLNLNRKI